MVCGDAGPLGADAARLDDDDVDVEGGELHAQRVGERLDGVLRGVVPAAERGGEAVGAPGGAVQDGVPAGAALVALLRDLASTAAEDRVAKEAARGLGVAYGAGESERAAVGAVRGLLEAGVRFGVIREDVTIDLYLPVDSIPAEADDARRERWVELVSRRLLVGR